MNFFKKVVGIVAILSFISIQLPQIGFAWQGSSYIKIAQAKGIKKHAPEFHAPPESKIPIEIEGPVERVEKRKTSKWLWVGLGVLAAGVLAGAGGGSGGDGGGGEAPGSIDISGPAP